MNMMNQHACNAYQDRANSMLATAMTNTHLAVDSSSWLLGPKDRQELLFKNIDVAQRISGAVLWIQEENLREVESKTHSDDPELRELAINALNKMNQMIAEYRLVVYASDAPNQRPFADAAFLARLVQNCPETPIGLITQDGDLACSFLNVVQDLRRTVNMKPCMVYRVNGAGNITRFNLLRTSEGKFVNPKNSPLHMMDKTVAAQVDDTPQPMADMSTDEWLWSPEGHTYQLGEEIADGGEGTIFEINGCPDVVAKVFAAPSKRKQAKVELLCRAAKKFPCPEAVMPQELLFDATGAFRGYLMMRVNGVELTRLFTSRGQERYVPHWDRRQYAHLASVLANLYRDFSLAGLEIADVAPGNVLIGYNDSGALDPEKVFFIDVDSAQFGSKETGVFPPDGLTPEYGAPEYLRLGVAPDQLRSPKSQVFSASLLCLQVAMVGVHPYRKTTEEGQTLSIPESIAAGAFAYGSGADNRHATAPTGADRLWSNMCSDLKRYAYDLFQQGGATNALQTRPSFFAMAKAFGNYDNWLKKPETLARFPEACSVAPAALKPFYTRCSNPQCKTPEAEFLVTKFRSSGRYDCPECLARRQQRYVPQAAPAAQVGANQQPRPAQAAPARPAVNQQPRPAQAAPAVRPAANQQGPAANQGNQGGFMRKVANWFGL